MIEKLNRKIFILIVVIFSIITIFMEKTAYANTQQDITWLTEKPIAHRGLFNTVYPENSIGAFKNAIKNGYPIELDVHLTKDNQVVVFHDDTLERMTGISKRVEDITYDEIKNLKLGNTEEKIPLFIDVLRLVNGRVPLIVEIKENKNIDTLSSRVYELLDEYEGKYAVQSFNTNVIQWYKDNAPQVIRGILRSGLDDKSCANFCKEIRSDEKYKPNYIAYDIGKVENEKIQQLREAGVPIIVWTIRNVKDEKKANKYADNLIFDSFIPKES